MNVIRFRTTDGAIHTMPRGMKLADAVATLRRKGIQLTGVLVDGIYQARSIH